MNDKLNKEESFEEIDFSKINFNEINFDDIDEMEEIVTPGNGSICCC